MSRLYASDQQARPIVAVAEDWILIEQITRMLEPLRVLTATSAARTVELASHERAQLVLIDMALAANVVIAEDIRARLPRFMVAAMLAKPVSGELMARLANVTSWCIRWPFTKQQLLASIARGNEASALTLESAKRSHIEKVLAMSGGNKSAAARILGLTRASLQRMLKRSL